MRVSKSNRGKIIKSHLHALKIIAGRGNCIGFEQGAADQFQGRGR